MIIFIYIFTAVVVAGFSFLAFAQESAFEQARRTMVTEQIERRGITDTKLLEALRTVRREAFVPESLRGWAYADTPLPIGYGQTISQPYIVALMTEKLALKGGEKVLEVGTGSGYQAAILCALGCTVYTVEIIKKLAQSAETTLKTLGYEVAVRWGDGYFGWEEHAPFDAIIVTCSVDHIPPPLLEQLKAGGRMVLPVGPPWSMQSLWLVQKTEEGMVVEDLGAVQFVPLTRDVREE
ncbi:MAG: protein-L-isoaspartate(D-aspartate) O-methyltransferase [Atribacterota bacterium]